MIPLKVAQSLSLEEETILGKRFVDLCESLAVGKAKAEDYYGELKELYGNPNRYYHNLVHIWNFLNLMDEYRAKIEENALFDLAIWYHDAIYEAKKKDNEYQSAQLFKTLFSDHLNLEQLAYVDTLIMSTAGHAPRKEEEDVYWFLDFDLAILAADTTTYQNYSEAIWQEYKIAYPKILYKMGRKKVLKNFLARERLYFTELFYSKNEAKARENIELELKA